jgi:hypothetical protein
MVICVYDEVFCYFQLNYALTRHHHKKYEKNYRKKLIIATVHVLFVWQITYAVKVIKKKKLSITTKFLEIQEKNHNYLIAVS